jgi:hypothetical protein
MGTERARDPMFKQSPLAASGSSACGARAQVAASGGARGSVHVCTPRVHMVAPGVLIPAGC